MKARLIRWLFATHRWAGVTLGLLMLVWCLSGFVMLYSPYPSTSVDGRDLRVEGLAPLAAPVGGWVLPAEDVLAPDASVSQARIEMLADRPVLHLAGEGARGVFDLATGEAITGLDEAGAIAVAAMYARQHGIDAGPSVKGLNVRDEFTVAGYLNAGRPYWQVRLNDDARTMLYVSSVTGEIRQRTTDSLRFWSWLGAIPHWLYFTELRKDAKLWSGVIIWTSLGGCFLTVLGLFVGLRQLRRRKSTGKLTSPYRGAKFWHHMFGLVFGVLVLTWTFSGFASMQPWGWLETGRTASEAAGRLSGARPVWADTRVALAAQLGGLEPGAVQVNLSPLAGESWFMHLASGGARDRRGPDGSPALFDTAAQAAAADLLAVGHGAPVVEMLDREDTYYYRGAAAGRLPVVRVTVPDMDNTAFYLDPVSGQIRAVADPGAKGFRWLHLALHRLDVAPVLRSRPVKDIVMWLLLGGVTIVCALGAWMGLRKLARGGRLDGRPVDPVAPDPAPQKGATLS